jgi:hypothetical protein
MKPLAAALAVLVLAAPADARAEAAFVRPDCPPADAPMEAEARCIRDVRRRWQEANFAALQETGLMFVYMARPDADASPAARAAVEQKAEGSFTVKFDVATDGTVYNVRTLDVTDGIEPLARLWADTIAQWTFTKTDQPVTDVEFRRIYLYPRDGEANSTQDAPDAH